MKKLIVLFFLIISLCSNSQTENKKLNQFIYDWIGSPYRYGGKSKKYGIDCSQFTKRLYKDVYSLNLKNTCRDQWYQTKRVVKDSLQEGDIVFFRSKSSPSGWHCGVYIGKGNFVHASNYRDGVKISNLNESMYKRIYRGSGRL